MRLWLVLWKFGGLLLVSGTLVDLFFQDKKYVPTSQINCYEYATNSKLASSRSFSHDRRSGVSSLPASTSTYNPRRYSSKRFRRSISDLSFKNDIYREHAKLVLDINGLKQSIYVPPVTNDDRDYDESIFHETIEMFSSTPKPKYITTSKPTKMTSFPIILAGGSINRPVLKSQPFVLPKSTINLVGTTGSPLLKHPYPFVMEAPHRPLRICMPAMALSSTTHRPSLWERLIKTLIPK